jgi:hypothetical protein
MPTRNATEPTNARIPGNVLTVSPDALTVGRSARRMVSGGLAGGRTSRRGDSMKYVVQWETRANASEELQGRGLQVFSKWQPSEKTKFIEFVGRVDGRGGFAVVETDDITAIARDMSIFGAFFDMSVYPVLEIAETARIGGDALEFRAAV